MLTFLLNCEIILIQIGDFKLTITPAITTGIADFFYTNSKKDRRNVPPLWMKDKEKTDWRLGQKIAKERLWVRS